MRKFFIKIIVNTDYIYFINPIQNILKTKMIKENELSVFFRNENKDCYYLLNNRLNDYNHDEFYKYFEEFFKKEEKNIKNIYPEFLNKWNISFEIY